MQLDHLVINTRFETDAAAARFEQLGFQLTPRGRHSLGSINHLMMFPGHYLELIGLPTDGGKLRQEVVDSVDGIDGLVFQTDDAEATAAKVSAAGVAMQAVQHFSRPVELDGTTRAARFETVRLVPGQYAAGRIYYCRHLTPELVWRDEWLVHPNGVSSIAELTVISQTPEATRRAYEKLDDTRRDDASTARTQTAATTLPIDDIFALRFETRDQVDARFGGLSAYLAERPEMFAAITFRCPDPEAVAARAAASGLPVERFVASSAEGALAPLRIAVALPAFGTLLEFIG